jgi:hypothetical protein
MHRMAILMCLLAAPAAAGSDNAEAPQVPEREAELGIVGKVIGADRRERVPTLQVYDPFEAALIGQRYVNQYVFENDAEAAARKADPRDYR